MNRRKINISSCMGVSVLLFLSCVEQANAACDPPKDISSCVIVPKAIFAQASPALPETPFLVADPQMSKKLVVTSFDRKPKPLPPWDNICNPSNVHGCVSVSSVELVHSGAVEKRSAPFLVHFQDGRSLLASPMP
ncbi:MAG: hypothetical protein WCP68_22860 [Enhydrobacter sp.]